jgi:RHS repeat-associated protein
MRCPLTLTSSRSWVTLIVGVLTVLAPDPATAQQVDPFDRYATRPDHWRPAQVSEPGVDARGDLNLSIPVLTIPGRGGLDYTVRFGYTSGVRYADRGSWVGTGWRFDPGSITRDVFGVLQSSLITGTHPSNVDFTDRPTVQPDRYYVTLPNSAATMIRLGTGEGVLRPIRQDSSGFYLTDWRAWRVSSRVRGQVWSGERAEGDVENLGLGAGTTFKLPGSTAEERSDYQRFVITTEDGTRYVFDHPTISTYFGINTDLSGKTTEQYVSTWRLRAILGPDYQGREIPSGTEAGAWVLLRYTPVMTARGPEMEGGTNAYPLSQSSYLAEVWTPTHRAVFDTDPRGYENFSEWEQVGPGGHSVHHYLRSITLHTRGSADPAEDSRVVRRVELDQSERFQTERQTLDGTVVPAYRRALDGIRFYGMGPLTGGQAGPMEPGVYRFTYYAGTSERSTDDFGYYNSGDDGSYLDPDDGRAWSLSSITHPSGGWDEVEYENDFIDATKYPSGFFGYERYDAVTQQTNAPHYSLGGRTRQGGVRVTKIKRYDGLSMSGGLPLPITTSYSYGPGWLTAAPSLHWRRLYGDYRFYLPNERGHAGVYYEHVERQEPDGGRVRTKYTTPQSHPSIVRPVETVVWEWPYEDGGPGGTSNPDGIRAMTLAQGNQDWAWGHAYEVEYYDASSATPVRRVTRTLALQNYEPDAPAQPTTPAQPATPPGVPILATAWDVSGVHARVEWSYGGRVTKETVKDFGAGGLAVETRTDYKYFDRRGTGYPDRSTGNGLLRSTTVFHEDGRRRETNYTYGPEEYYGPGQHVATNRLTPVIREEVLERNAGNVVVNYHAATVTRWRSIQPPIESQSFGPVTLFAPYDVYVWQAAAPSPTRPGFSAWAGGTPGAEWQRKGSTEAYNTHAFATRTLDARGFATTMQYDAQGRLARVEKTTGSGIVLGRSFTYHPHFGLLDSIEDERGKETKFVYDAFGRLDRVRDRTGAIVLDYTYESPRETGAAAGRLHHSRPNVVKTTRFTGGSPAENVGVEFFDGLGRLVQSQELDEGGQYAVTGRRYLTPSGGPRVEQVRRHPGLEPTLGKYFGGIVWLGPSGFAPGLADDEPPSTPSVYQNYTETRYSRDGTGRGLGVTYPNAGTGPIPQVFTYHGVTTIGTTNYRYTATYDEAREVTRRVVDGWGNEVRTVRRPSGALSGGLITETVFDAMGRPVRVCPPNVFAPGGAGTCGGTATPPWATTYEYDTQGRLTRRTTPDAGEARYAYDTSGNLRFTQDALRLQHGEFVATRYDELGRPTRSGIFALSDAGVGDFDALSPTQPYTAMGWEDNVDRWVEVNAYDQKPTTSGMPWATFATQIGAFQGAGRLGHRVATATKSDGAWQLELSGYDHEERITAQLVHTQESPGGTVVGAYDTELKYTYDLQSRLLTRETRVGAASTWFRHWYEYDARGLLARIYAGATTGRPATPDATYTYYPSGAVQTLRYGTHPVVSYWYDLRDRLTKIGGDVGQGSPPHPFQAEYVYEPDGDVAQAAFYQRHVDVNETRDYYSYCYDGYDRLSFAARLVSAHPDPTTQCTDVFGGGAVPDGPYSVADLTYDANGNILTLARLDQNGTVIDNLTYSYVAGTNRLASITDAANNGGATAAAWDAEAGALAYDANGNATQLPAPHLVTAATYDRRNLPLSITANGQQHRYRYAASGQRYLERALTMAVETTNSPGEPAPELPPAPRIPGGDRLEATARPVPAAPTSPTAQAAPAPQEERSHRGGVRYAPRFGAHRSAADEAEGDRDAPTSGDVGRDRAQEAERARAVDPPLGDASERTGARPPRFASGRTEQEPAPRTVEELPHSSTTGGAARWASRSAPTRANTPRVDSTGESSTHATSTVLGAPRMLPPAQRYGTRLAPAQAYGVPAPAPSGANNVVIGESVAYSALDALDPQLPVAERAPSGAITFNLLTPSGGVVGRQPSGGGRLYYHKDLLGSTRAVVDENGILVESRAYDAFGLEMHGRVSVQGTRTREGFTGHELDQETGMNYAGARYYMPALGRWTSVDPPAELYPSWSPYNYVLNNPVGLIDPFGTCPDGSNTGDVVTDENGVSSTCLDAEGLIVTAEREPPSGPIQFIDGFYGGIEWGMDQLPFVEQIRAVGEGREVSAGAAIWAGATSLPITRPLRYADEAADAINLVYRSVDEENIVRYIGITNDFLRRRGQHLRRGRDIVPIPGLSGLTRADARAVEQALIEHHGLARIGGTLQNRINSIASWRPGYADAVRRGREILERAGYILGD